MQELAKYLQEVWAEKISHLHQVGQIDSVDDRVDYFYVSLILLQLDGVPATAAEMVQFGFASKPSSVFGFIALAGGGPVSSMSLGELDIYEARAEEMRKFMCDIDFDSLVRAVDLTGMSMTPNRDRLVLRVENKIGGKVSARIVRQLMGHRQLASEIAYFENEKHVINFKEVEVVIG